MGRDREEGLVNASAWQGGGRGEVDQRGATRGSDRREGLLLLLLLLLVSHVRVPHLPGSKPSALVAKNLQLGGGETAGDVQDEGAQGHPVHHDVLWLCCLSSSFLSVAHT